jgi:hypothetical protein
MAARSEGSGSEGSEAASKDSGDDDDDEDVSVGGTESGSESGCDLIEDDQDGSEEMSDEAEASHGLDGSADSGEDF